MKHQPLLFLDTSVLMAALFSSRGGSRGILELSHSRLVNVIITEEVTVEAIRKIERKYGAKELNNLATLLIHFDINVKLSPSVKEIKRFDDIILDKKDSHILAGAAKYKTDYLITLDRKHFMTERLKQANLPFEIRTPQTFLNEFREQSNERK